MKSMGTNSFKKCNRIAMQGKSFWKSRNLFTKRFLAAGGKVDRKPSELFYHEGHEDVGNANAYCLLPNA